MCGETDGVQSQWNKPTALCIFRNTVFVCDTGNKAVRILTSAKGLIPLQSKMAQCANVFQLDKKAKDEDLPRTFEDHVKCVKELVSFLSNNEQEALERMGKWNTNGPNMTIPQWIRQSFLIVLQSLTSLANTLTEIEHSHLLDRICLESMTTLVVECYFKEIRADHDMRQWLTTLTEERAAWKTICCAFIRRISHISLGPIHFIWRNLSKVNPQISRGNQTSSQQRRRHKARNCDA